LRFARQVSFVDEVSEEKAPNPDVEEGKVTHSVPPERSSKRRPTSRNSSGVMPDRTAMRGATNVGGVNSVRLSAPCAQKADAPDRIVYQAWSWELTSGNAWIDSLEAALATIRLKRPSARRIDIMTIVRCPPSGWCHSDKPPLGPNTDHDATKEDCHVPEYIDAAMPRVAANHPDLVSVSRSSKRQAARPGSTESIYTNRTARLAPPSRRTTSPSRELSRR
jgi:hypothetical protein